MMYGWRARLGNIRPAAAIEGSEEWRSVAPDGVALIDARTYLPEISDDGLDAMMSQVLRATQEVKQARPSVVVQCGAPGIFLKGPEYEANLIAEMEKIAGVPCTTMMTAMVDALRALDSTRPALATIYTDAMNERLAGYLGELGITAAGMVGLQTRQSGRVMDHEPEVAYRLGRDAVNRSDSPDSVVISCGGLRTFEVIEALEADTGLPVVTSNQASLWSALTKAGVSEPLSGLGRLLRSA